MFLPSTRYKTGRPFRSFCGAAVEITESANFEKGDANNVYNGIKDTHETTRVVVAGDGYYENIRIAGPPI